MAIGMLKKLLVAAFAVGCAAATASTASHGVALLRTAPSAGIKHQYSALELRGGGAVLENPAPAVVQSLEATEVLHCDNLLGEAPMWHAQEEALYWLDINGEKLWRFHPASGEQKMWALPEKAGSFAFAEEEGSDFLMGFASGLSWWDRESGAVSRICEYEPGMDTRPNDGKCDRQGNFLIGSYNNKHRVDEKNIAGLWRLNTDLSLQEVLDYRFRCSNTIAFSKDGSQVYFCDTPTREIFRFDYSPTGMLSGKTSFYKMEDKDEGGPDGATVDSQGGLWEAQAGNWRVVRHRASDGVIDYEVKLPFNNPTSVAVGGDTLYITTARHRLSDEQRVEQPGAGQLWAVKLPEGIQGVEEPKFKGCKA